MKIKNKLVLITALLISFQTMFAQNEEVSNGPVPTLKQERTKEEFKSNDDLVTAGYAYSATNQNILSASGACGFDFLAYWPTADYLSSMCHGGDGKYYVTGTNSPSLYQLDTINVSFVLLGTITGMGSNQPNGISYNPVNGNYYIASSSNLFSFNVNTRTATLIGPFNTGGIMIDLCFDSSGICYAYDIGTDNGYTIDISTGNANLLGPLGYNANYGQGMSYDFDTQTIYITEFNNVTFTGQCRTMDPVTGNTTLLYDWGLEQIDAFALNIFSLPVELISFNADVENDVVNLLWQTATETNNSGFEVERSQMSNVKGQTEWQRIGFVEGKGTTTEIQSYSFTDKPEPGIYKYRLKQLDFDGSFEYSQEIEAAVNAPLEFSLEQNYPNPFNPSTKIKYTIPNVTLRQAQSNILVTLKVYDILGSEVAELVNEEQPAGSYEIEFNSVGTSRDLSLPSGIYFYQLKAGQFVETKKMILLK
jgi:hypothetical protein